eukprot:g1751.t1
MEFSQNFENKSALEIDNLIEAQEEEIRKEIENAQEFIGELEPLVVLEEVYRDNTRFHSKIRDLKSLYSGIRRARADGNCFYRALMFSWFERLIPYAKTDIGRRKAAELVQATGAETRIPNKVTDVNKVLKTDEGNNASKSENNPYVEAVNFFQGSVARCVKVGYTEYLLEDFLEACVDVLADMPNSSFDAAELTRRFQDQSCSDYIVCYVRVLTAAYIKENRADFECFIDAMHPGLGIEKFCSGQVEAMAKDVDQVQILALCGALGVSCRIAYLDGAGGKLNHHNFPAGKVPMAFLLFRPGHYDVLYPKEK